MTGRIKKGLVSAASVALIGGTSLVAAAPAQAYTIHPGAKAGQVDILLDGTETIRAAQGPWGSTVICAQLVSSSAQFGALGAFAAGMPCMSVISVCAAKAALAHKWAGVTVQPTWPLYYCWQY